MDGTCLTRASKLLRGLPGPVEPTLPVTEPGLIEPGAPVPIDPDHGQHVLFVDLYGRGTRLAGLDVMGDG